MLCAKDAIKTALVMDVSTVQPNSDYDPSKTQEPETWKFGRWDDRSQQHYVVFKLSSLRQLRVFSMIKHNLSNGALWRIRVANAQADLVNAPTYDSGWIELNPGFSGYGALAWGEFQWGQYNFFAQETGFQRASGHTTPDPVLGSWVRYDFDDTNSGAVEDFIQIARLWASSAYQPSFNVNYGAQIVPLDETKERRSESGVRHYSSRKVRRRSMILPLSGLPVREMLYNLMGPFVLGIGKEEELIAILQPDDRSTMPFQIVYGGLAENLPAFTHEYYDGMSATLEIEERI